MKKKKTILILAVFITFISLGSLSFAQECPITNCTDADNDTYTSDGLPNCNDPSCSSCICGDCNDSNPNSHPGAGEICDGEDNDCNSLLPSDEADEDNDGFMICENDCNDDDQEINPDADEICDYIDNNCDGNIDEGVADTCINYTTCISYTTCASCPPPHQEICNNTIDDDCDGAIDCADKDCKNDPACASQPCASEGYACNNTEECCGALKCKRQVDSPKTKICCEKDECAAIAGCVEENTCINITISHIRKITRQKVCAHGTWIPKTMREHNCNDKIDNDCDNKIDCDDTEDCKHRPTCLNTICTTDKDCKGYQTCINGICKLLVCKGCTHPEDNTCQKWECCRKKDCDSGEICWKHECIEAPESRASMKKYIKENARSYIDEAEQKILDKKNIKPRAREIKTLEKKLNRAKSAYSRGRYEEAESLATETITGYKQRKTIIERVNAFLHKIKSFFVREKKSEPEKQYASGSDFALQ